MLGCCLALGNLDNGGHAGAWYLNANNGVSGAWWSILARISDFSVKILPYTPPTGSLKALSGISAKWCKTSVLVATAKAREFERKKMRTYCKNINITDVRYLTDTIRDYVYGRKKKRQKTETAELLAGYANLDKHVLLQAIKNRDGQTLEPIIIALAVCIRDRITTQTVTIPPIKYRQKIDPSSGKLRELGIQSAIHKVYDYIATVSLMPLLKARIGSTQYASIPKRGQVKGKKKLEKWMRQTKIPARYAAQGDIRKCYQSIPITRLKELLYKYIRNPPLTYLVDTLLDAFKHGLSIGSYLSQWLCNYYLSFTWHYAKEQLYKLRKKKDGTYTRIPLISRILFYMDDFIIIGTRKTDVKKAMKQIVVYLKDELGTIVKPDWKLFTLDYIRKGIHHGQPIDMMGYVIYRHYTKIRSKIFLRARRVMTKAKWEIRALQNATLQTAKRVSSYYGWFKNSDSVHYQKTQHIKNILNRTREVMRNESLRIRSQTATNPNLSVA